VLGNITNRENIVPEDETLGTNRKPTGGFKRDAETHYVYSEKRFKEENSEKNYSRTSNSEVKRPNQKVIVFVLSGNPLCFKKYQCYYGFARFCIHLVVF
jgi:hypothetical protein